MSFFTRWFSKDKKMSLENAPSSKTNKVAMIIKKLGLAFVTGSGAAAKKDFQEPTFSLDDINKAYNTDSYIRQAIDKYVDLIFKAGWDITGKNQKTVDYINLRLAAISEATQMNTSQLLREVTEDLVKYANVFIIKARATNSYTFPAGISVTATDVKPVAGYFILPPTTIKIARDENGSIAKYQQEVSGKNAIEFKPEDIIHISWKKERGQAFGVSFLTPVLDDVRILRQIEEDVVRLIYRHLFPLHTYTVGIDKPGYEATDEEINAVREMIRDLPLDGGVVIPERHKIDVVGTQGKALEIYDYLDYFRARVFTGLGVSESIMGVGGATNRATAESMSDEMRDRIKAFQRVLEDGIEFCIVNELLREGGFDPLLKPEDKVYFKFREIDLDSRTKMEQSVSQLWLNDLVTFEEARQFIGYEPVVDESRLHSRFVTTFVASENYKAEAQNAPTPTVVKKTAAMRESLVDLRLANMINEHSRKLEYHWDLTKSDVIELVKQYYLTQERNFNNFNPKEISSIINLTRDSIDRISEQYVRSSLLAGVDAARRDIPNSNNTMPNINYSAYTRELSDIHAGRMTVLLEEDLTYLIKTAMRSANQEDAIAKIVGAFSSLQFRLRFTSDYELKKAYYYGFARCAEWFGYEELTIITTENCEKCKISDTTLKIKDVSLYRVIPPFHPSCSCSLTVKKGDE